MNDPSPPLKKLLQKVKIVNLFGRYTYSVNFNEGKLIILTAPNGYGKTTFLKLIHSVLSPSLEGVGYLLECVYDEIELTFSSGFCVTIEKSGDKINLRRGDDHIKEISYTRYEKIITRFIEKSPIPFRRTKEGNWVDVRSDLEYSLSEIISLINESEFAEDFEKTDILGVAKLNLQDSYFISHNRLLVRRNANSYKRSIRSEYSVRDKNDSMPAVNVIADELLARIRMGIRNQAITNQKLDGSFPHRLFSNAIGITEDEFSKRYNFLKNKQERLAKFGFFQKWNFPVDGFREDHAKAIRIYLDDTEAKLAVFDSLIGKLELFDSAINEKRFNCKKVVFSEEGISIKLDSGKNIPLSQLSSGEQQQFVLSYEMLFKVQNESLLLIDEPEISLHVEWQQEFIGELMLILKDRGLSAIVATHSPQVIGENWDLVSDLKYLAQARS